MSKLLAARFSGVPVLAAHGQEHWFGECLSTASVEMEKIQLREHDDRPRMQDDYWPASDSWLATYRPYQVNNGTLSLPVKGVLLHDFGYQLGNWATGYLYLRKALERGLADPEVQRIALVISSGGGEVAGNFDLVDAVYRARGEKPIHAFYDEHGYSAAFSFGSAAEFSSMPRTGGVGSVGVVTAHADYSRMMETAGVKITFIHAGDHKVEGNPYEPLSAEAEQRMQARINGLYDIFVATVARNLNMSEEEVRGTQALTYSAEDALALGFVHEIRPIDEALAAFSSGLETTVGDTTMTVNTEAEKPNAITQADVDAARAEGTVEGAKAERERIKGILGSDEAATRNSLATHIAMDTDMTVEAARQLMAAAPEQATAPQASQTPGADFAAAMTHGNPEISPENQETAGQQADPLTVLLSDYGMASGYRTN